MARIAHVCTLFIAVCILHAADARWWQTTSSPPPPSPPPFTPTPPSPPPPSNKCCRQGYEGNGCATTEGGESQHMCVNGTTSEIIGEADCWSECSSTTGYCAWCDTYTGPSDYLQIIGSTLLNGYYTNNGEGFYIRSTWGNGDAYGIVENYPVYVYRSEPYAMCPYSSKQYWVVAIDKDAYEVFGYTCNSDIEGASWSGSWMSKAEVTYVDSIPHQPTNAPVHTTDSPTTAPTLIPTASPSKASISPTTSSSPTAEASVSPTKSPAAGAVFECADGYSYKTADVAGCESTCDCGETECNYCCKASTNSRGNAVCYTDGIPATSNPAGEYSQKWSYGCDSSSVGNGVCDGKCNNPDSGFDGGDCCAATNSNPQSTDTNPLICQDPAYATEVDANGIPKTWNFAYANPVCRTQIRDQGQCGSCYAFAVTTAAIHQHCYSSDSSTTDCEHCGDYKASFYSPQYIDSCPVYGGAGSGVGMCDGGYTSYSWSAWASEGYRSDKCYPYAYSGDANDHYTSTSDAIDCDTAYEARLCTNGGDSCTVECPNPSDEDYLIKHAGSSRYSSLYVNPDNADEIKRRLYTEGPVPFSFSVYQNWQYYDWSNGPVAGNGLYSAEDNSGRSVGGHAVVLLGWGEYTDASGATKKYWTFENSYGYDGEHDQGMFYFDADVDWQTEASGYCSVWRSETDGATIEDDQSVDGQSYAEFTATERRHLLETSESSTADDEDFVYPCLDDWTTLHKKEGACSSCDCSDIEEYLDEAFVYLSETVGITIAKDSDGMSMKCSQGVVHGKKMNVEVTTSSGSCFKVKMQQAAAARCNVYNEDGTPDLESCKPANCTFSFEDLSDKIYSRGLEIGAAANVESASTSDSYAGVSAFFGLSLTMYVLMAAVFAGVMYFRRVRSNQRTADAYGTFTPIPDSER